MGTNFAVVALGTRAYPLANTRTVIVKTNGSSDCNDWILAYEVSSIATTKAASNFGLVPTASGDRILNTYVSTAGGTYKIVLDVYDATLTLQRSVDLYDSLTMANVTDTTAAGRVSNYTHNAITLTNYNGRGVTYGFTWNPFNETFHQHFNSYFTYHTPAGGQVGQGIGVSISFSIPRTWFENGTGTLVNQIPIKSGTYRYNMLSDSTWGTLDGGMASLFVGGAAGSLITDEYSGDMWMTYKGSFQSNYGASNIYRYKANSGHIYQTIDASPAFAGQYTTTGVVNIPDGSPWSKSLISYFGHVIGNNILMYVNSIRYGTIKVQTTFSTSEFASVQAGMTNDTLKLDSAGALISPQVTTAQYTSTWPAAVATSFNPGNMGTVVVGGTPIYYFSNGGSLVYTITASGSTRNFTSTGVTMPVVPAAIDTFTGIVDQDVIGWNGDTVNPIWWAVVRDSTGMVYMAKNMAGSWSIVSTNMFQPTIDAGKSNRGDTVNNIFFPSYSGHPLITENGRFLFNFVINYTGGNAFYWGCFDINSNVATYGDISRFQSLGTGPGKYGAISGYPGATFGYSTTFGYYHYQATPVYDAAYFCSSRDVRGVAADITEDQWFNHTATRSEIWITSESATGLVAYLSAFPIFLGGYFSTMATQSVALQPSTDNYIYAARNATDRNVIDVSVSTLQLPSSFSRVLLAKVSTNATRIVGQVNYNIAPHDAIEDLENVSITTKAIGDLLKWDGTNWVNGGVDYSSLAADSVGTKQLAANDLGNLCYNGKGDNLDGWRPGMAGGVTAGLITGTNFWTAVGVASNTTLTFHNRDNYFGGDFAVTPGDVYTCSADVTTAGSVVSTYDFNLGLFFLDVNGAVLSWTGGANKPIGSVYRHIAGAVTVPAGAAKARLWVQIDGAGGTLYTGAGQVHHATNIQVRYAIAEYAKRVPIVNVASDRDVQATDAGHMIVVNSAGRYQWVEDDATMTTNYGAPIPIGTIVSLTFVGSGTVTFLGSNTSLQIGVGATSGVMAYNVAASGQVTLVKIAANYWTISGVGIT
jgi:hypothetical protein